MQIAPGIDSTEWIDLQLDDPEAVDWARAIEIVEKRIRGRFLDAVDHLVALEAPLERKQRRFGFAVLAIDCLLVETLQAFWEGLEKTDRRSGEMFVNFLTRSTHFAPPFDFVLAERFFRQFRCGILHQAEIWGDSRVVSEGPLIAEEAT